MKVWTGICLQYDFQRGVQSLVRDLNRVYRDVSGAA